MTDICPCFPYLWCRNSPSFSSVASSDSGNSDEIQEELEKDGEAVGGVS